ncbi:MAG: RNA ligase [Wendovervirus sonii]|uniref:RNA ligase n=1 Tax=phage Lak_Megaphage_Sonny TaxID=3109229 RepID=A0ABZ0Z5I4_9CAUD|nr:MAG: RNA ligase [phage Lak_Megaphage_Sonny]
MGKQKRSANTYTKINTIFKRDINNCIMPYDSFAMPELEWLKDCKFDADEKIDGTCIRIEVSRILSETKLIWSVDYKGKTDNADIPKKLEEHLKTKYPEEKVLNALGLTKEMQIDETLTIEKGWTIENVNDGNIIRTFDETKIPTMYTLYGEGYGAGIQSGGYYRKDNAFIGFDVKVNNMYLLRKNRNEIFDKLDCPIVPYIGQFTIQEAIEFVKKGFNSRIAEEEHLAEGLVLRCPDGILTRRGDRIIFKIKTCDWNKYYAKYGTYDQVEQIPNPKIEY